MHAFRKTVKYGERNVQLKRERTTYRLEQREKESSSNSRVTTSDLHMNEKESHRDVRRLIQ